MIGTSDADAPRCPRCGQAEVPVVALAAIARRSRVRLDAMRQPVPADVASGLREVDTALACMARLCSRENHDLGGHSAP